MSELVRASGDAPTDRATTAVTAPMLNCFYQPVQTWPENVSPTLTSSGSWEPTGALLLAGFTPKEQQRIHTIESALFNVAFEQQAVHLSRKKNGLWKVDQLTKITRMDSQWRSISIFIHVFRIISSTVWIIRRRHRCFVEALASSHFFSNLSQIFIRLLDPLRRTRSPNVCLLATTIVVSSLDMTERRTAGGGAHE